MMKKLIPALLASFCIGCNLLSPTVETPPSYQEISWTDQWRFARYGKQADLFYITEPSDELLASPDFNDQHWELLDLPHDWAINGPFHPQISNEQGKLPFEGIGWYRKTLTLTEADSGKEILLFLDGVMGDCTVYCNGEKGETLPFHYVQNLQGLAPLRYDGVPNQIAIRVNAENLAARWYPGGGIYRDVRIKKIDSRGWLSANKCPYYAYDYEKQAFVLSPVVLNDSQKIEISLWNQNECMGYNDEIKEVAAPELWSPENPKLYTLKVALFAENGDLIDAKAYQVGFRILEFSADEGFKLNGIKYPLQGVCLHHDLGAIGAAENRSALVRRFKILKTMGCNAIRVCHNPASPLFLDLTDEYGFLVIPEGFDTWRHAKVKGDFAQHFNKHWERVILNMVCISRHHPSVFMWSAGNEVHEQYEGAKGAQTPWEINQLIQSLDFEKRPCTVGVSIPEGGWNGFQKGLDVMGYNYRLNAYDRWFKSEDGKIKPMLSSESASTVSSRGYYTFPPKRKNAVPDTSFQVSSFDLETPPWGTTPDEQFAMLNKYPQMLGEFVWTGFDYLGEPTPYNSGTSILLNLDQSAGRGEIEKNLKAVEKIRPMSRSSYFGILDLAGFPKDRFYLYKSRWMPDSPVAHLMPHWNWPEFEDNLVSVQLYTNGDEAELFINGVSQGVKHPEKGQHRILWEDVVYRPGRIMVNVKKQGHFWAHDAIVTAGKAEKVILEKEESSTTFVRDPKELIFINARIADANNNTVPRTDYTLRFRVEGDAEIVATDNGDPNGLVPFNSHDRAAFNGLAQVIVRPLANGKGPIKVIVTSDELTSGEITLEEKK